MFKYKSISENSLKAVKDAEISKINYNQMQANLDYIAMMTEVEIPEGENTIEQ